MWTDKKLAEIASAVAVDEIEDATIESSQISSGEATIGQVLTADGDGGVSWEDASGGSDLYIHHFRFNAASGDDSVWAYATLILPFETELSKTNVASLLKLSSSIKLNMTQLVDASGGSYKVWVKGQLDNTYFAYTYYYYDSDTSKLKSSNGSLTYANISSVADSVAKL